MSAPIPLRTSTLPQLGRRVDVPRYRRTALVPSVVHLSVGSFHRSHQAMYFERLARIGHTAWGLVGVGLRRPDMREALVAQDGLYTVVERGGTADRACVVGVIRRYLLAPEHGADVIATLADPRTRLVTLTITAGGYGIDPGTGAFDPADPAIAADLARPDRPSTALGYLVAALDRRRRTGLGGFTVLSCDNVTGNGRIARTAVLAVAAQRDPSLAAWIGEQVAFPDSMVDRITPRTTDADRAFVAERFGVEDRWPVMTEPFSQWVVDDVFSAGRPPLDEVGVQFVGDVRPYALLKTRLLNAGHCALAYLGSQAGHEHADTAACDPLFAAFLDRLMTDEVAPLLPAVPGVDLAAYRATTLERLRNPALADRLERLGRAGSGKVPRHIVPSILAAREQGRDHALLTLAVAAWFRHLRGRGMQGEPVQLDDPLAPILQPLAIAGGTDPRPLLSERSLFGDLGDDAGFVADLEEALVSLDRLGARGSLEARLVGDREAAA